MDYLIANNESLVQDLNESIIFLAKLIVNEIDHDKKLVEEANIHIRSLLELHSAISGVKEVV